MRLIKESFGKSVRDEVKEWTRFLIDHLNEFNEIQLCGTGIITEEGNLVSTEGFRLKQSEIQYIKKRILKSKDIKWESETRYIEGNLENFGKVEVLTKTRAQ